MTNREREVLANTPPECLPHARGHIRHPDKNKMMAEQWEKNVKRRGELIAKKNRGGLNEAEQAEYTRLEQFVEENWSDQCS